MSFCEALFEVVFWLTFTLTTSTTCVVLGEIIAAHQHGIIRRSRQLQNLFYLPTCTHIFSEADNQIRHGDIKVSAIALPFTILFSSAGMLGVLIEGPTAALSRPWVACGVITLMVTPGLLLWTRLTLTCWRRQRNRKAVAWDVDDVSIDEPEMDRGVESNETTALLSAEKGPKAGGIDNVDESRLIQDALCKKEFNTVDKGSHGGGRSDAYVPRVSWVDSELPFTHIL